MEHVVDEFNHVKLIFNMDMIDLVKFQEKEPETYADILKDYPAKEGLYQIRNLKGE